MNNRKQKNKRGVNPRQYRVQITQEPATLTIPQEAGGSIKVDNPHAGEPRKLIHRNFKG